MLLLFHFPFCRKKTRALVGPSMENMYTYEGESVFLEHDYCCNYVNIDNNNNGDDDGNESKEKVLRTKYNRAFSAVDKWVDSIISRVPTGNDTMRKIDREITIHKVKYPFLPEQQIRGKVYKKFGIPSVMGGVLNKSTFPGSSLKNRARQRRRAIKKMDLKREPEDIKIDKKFLKLSEDGEELSTKNVSSTLDFGVQTLKYENSWKVHNSLMTQNLKREEKETQDTESTDFLTFVSPLNIEDLEKERTLPSVRPHFGLESSQKWKITDIFEKELQYQTSCTICQTFDKELENESSLEKISVHSQPTQIVIRSCESPQSAKSIPEQRADIFKKELQSGEKKCVTCQRFDKELENGSSLEKISIRSQPTQIVIQSFESLHSAKPVPDQQADILIRKLQSGENKCVTCQTLDKELKKPSSLENISTQSQPTQIFIRSFESLQSAKFIPEHRADIFEKEPQYQTSCTIRQTFHKELENGSSLEKISAHSQPTQIIIRSFEGPHCAKSVSDQRADILKKELQSGENKCVTSQTLDKELKNLSSTENICTQSQPTQIFVPSFGSPYSIESVPRKITDIFQKELENGKNNSIYSQSTQVIPERSCSAEFIPKRRGDIFQKDVQIESNCRSHQTLKEEVKNSSYVANISFHSQPTQLVAPSCKNSRFIESALQNMHAKIDTSPAATGISSEDIEAYDLENATPRSNRSRPKRFSSYNNVSDYLGSFFLQNEQELNPKPVEGENHRNILEISGVLKSVGNSKRFESPLKVDNCNSYSKKQGRFIENGPSFDRESFNRDFSMDINSTIFQNDNTSDKYHGEIINMFEGKENIPGCSIPASTEKQESSWRKRMLPMDKGPLEKKRRMSSNLKSPMKSEIFQTGKISTLQQNFTNLKAADARFENVGRKNVKILPKIVSTGHVNVPLFVMIEPLSNHCCEYDQDFDKISKFCVGSVKTQSPFSTLKESDEILDISEKIEEILDFLDKNCEKNETFF